MSDATTTPPNATAAHERHLRPGQLVPAWRAVVVVGWAAIAVALMVTAGAAEILHRSVWWIGDRSDPAPILFTLIPFALPILVIVLALMDRKYVVELSAVAAAGLLLVAFGDREGSPSAAIVTAALGVAGVLLTIAAVSGRVRSA